MAGTPCGRLICDTSGPRPEYSGKQLDLPDILVFNVPSWKDSKRFQVVPSYMTKDPKLVGKTRHQQAIDIMDESEAKQKREVGNLYPEGSITTDLGDFISAGSVHAGEPKTQSCTVNNQDGNPNAGQEGQMVEEQREEFMHVWSEMVKTGKDKMLKEIIENRLERSLNVRVPSKDHWWDMQDWGITVYGQHTHL